MRLFSQRGIGVGLAALLACHFFSPAAMLCLALAIVRESTSRQAQSHLRQFLPVVWWASRVEVHSAVARLHRLGKLKDPEKKGACLVSTFLVEAGGKSCPLTHCVTLQLVSWMPMNYGPLIAFNSRRPWFGAMKSLHAERLSLPTNVCRRVPRTRVS
jgi:hypothetical protein